MVRRAEARWADEARPRYAAVIAAWAARDLGTTPATQLLDGAREIVRDGGRPLPDHPERHPARRVQSEMLFISFYNRLIKRKDDPTALTFLLGFDSAPILAEKSLYDLATWARTQPALAGYLGRAAAGEIAAALQVADRRPSPTRTVGASSAAGSRTISIASATRIYDLDFAKGLAADEPAPLLETLKFFLTGQARSPHERQSTAATAREQATEALLARLNGIRLRLFRPLLRTAQRYAPLREEALADVGLGWPLLRADRPRNRAAAGRGGRDRRA